MIRAILALLKLWMVGSVVVLCGFALVILATIATGMTSVMLETSWTRLTGTIVWSLTALGLTTPVGVAVGIWLALRGRRRSGSVLKRALQGLHRIPTVTVGVALALMAETFGWKAPELTCIAALAIIALPDIAVGVERALRQVPGHVWVDMQCLGANELDGLTWIVLPAASRRLCAAILRAGARLVAQLTPMLVILGWPDEPAGEQLLTVAAFAQVDRPGTGMGSVVVLIVLAWLLRLSAFRFLLEQERR